MHGFTGVDFIKYDCVFAKDLVYDNILGAYNGMEDSGHDFVFSLSPGGNVNISAARDVANITNSYRITSDTWDLWDPAQATYESSITSHFNETAYMAQHGFINKPGLNGGRSFLDLDMLPLGYMSSPWDGEHNCEPHKQTSLLENEQRVLMTLWCIARSPLMFGGEVMKLENDKFTLDLITNKYCLDVNYASTSNAQVVGNYTKDGLPQRVIWSADGMDNDYYVAFFYVNYEGGSINEKIEMEASFEVLGIDSYGACDYIEAWSNQTGRTESGKVQISVGLNDTALLYLNNCK